jgi:hypothetical protein
VTITDSSPNNNYATRDSVAQLASSFQTVFSQFKEVQAEFQLMKNKFDQIDNRLATIESFCKQASQNSAPKLTSQQQQSLQHQQIRQHNTRSQVVQPRPSSQSSSIIPPTGMPNPSQQQQPSTVSRQDFESTTGKMNKLTDAMEQMTSQLNVLFGSNVVPQQ